MELSEIVVAAGLENLPTLVEGGLAATDLATYLTDNLADVSTDEMVEGSGKSMQTYATNYINAAVAVAGTDVGSLTAITDAQIVDATAGLVARSKRVLDWAVDLGFTTADAADAWEAPVDSITTSMFMNVDGDSTMLDMFTFATTSSTATMTAAEIADAGMTDDCTLSAWYLTVTMATVLAVATYVV